MSTLLIRLAAPLQSWGVGSKFEERRDTMREPTKSGVIGIIAAAFGRSRDDPLDDLIKLRFGVRIDQPGQILRDFHTARFRDGHSPYVTNRYYLTDAIFLVGLEGEDDFLHEIENALLSPVYPLYLGRRSCPPVGQISLGIFKQPLEETLRNAPWQACKYYQKRFLPSDTTTGLTLILDSDKIGNLRRRDIPISFSQKYRKYAFRYIHDVVNSVHIPSNHNTDHDAFEALDKEV